MIYVLPHFLAFVFYSKVFNISTEIKKSAVRGFIEFIELAGA